MSKIIKSSRIIGEYRIDDKKITKESPNNEIDEGNQQQEILQLYQQQAQAQVAEIIESAREKALEIIEQARVEGEKKQEEGFNQGYKEGLKRGQEVGEEKGLQQFKDKIVFLDKVVNQIQEELQQDIDGLKSDIIELVVKIAERIVNTELEIHPEIINNIVSEILDEMGEIQKINIHLNPNLSKYIKEEDLKTRYARKQLYFIFDSSLKPGDCIVETKLGGRDGSIETKLNLIKKELLKGVGFYEGA